MCEEGAEEAEMHISWRWGAGYSYAQIEDTWRYDRKERLRDEFLRLNESVMDEG